MAPRGIGGRSRRSRESTGPGRAAHGAAIRDGSRRHGTNLARTRTRRQGPCHRRCAMRASVSASKRSYYSCLSPRHHLWGGAHVAQAEGGPTYGNQGGEEARPVSELDLAKALNVGASAKPRSKGQVFGAIAQHVGVHRRDVVSVF